MTKIELNTKKTDTFEAYANYGCLAAEKRIVWTTSGKASDITDDAMITAPIGWKICKGECRELYAIAPNGDRFLVNKILAGKEAPYFNGYYSDGNKFNIKLDYEMV